MEPVAYWRAIRKSWIAIVVLMVVGLAVGFGAGKVMHDSYKATTSLFVSATQGANTTELQQGGVFAQAQVQSYAELATTPSVLKPVIASLGLTTNVTDLAKSVTSTNPLNTVIVQITVTEPTGAKAAEIANAVSESLRTVVDDLSPKTQNGKPAISMSIVTPAQVPTTASSPNRHLIDLAGLIVGLIVGVIYALARASSDTRIGSEKDVTSLTDVPVIGRVQRPTAKGAITLRDSPTAPAAEDFRRIRATLQFAGVDGPVKSLTVTSPSSQEERTIFAINLALSSAERSQRVLLIDADLRDAGVATATGTASGAGLVDVLAGSISLADAVTGWHGVDVLATGTVPSNPNVVLGSPSVARLLAEARATYDFIVVDTPPLLPYADALAVVRETDGALVLTSGKHTTGQQLVRALTSLDGVKATTIGVVLVDSEAVVRQAKNAKASRGAPARSATGRPAASDAEPKAKSPSHLSENAEANTSSMAPARSGAGLTEHEGEN